MPILDGLRGKAQGAAESSEVSLPMRPAEGTGPAASRETILSRVTQRRPRQAPARTTGEDAVRTEHDRISENLVQLAVRLKANNVAFQEAVHGDRSTLLRVEAAIGGNAQAFGREQKSLQSFTRASWANTWRLIILGLLVVASLLVAFFLILVT